MSSRIKYIGDSTPEVHYLKNSTHTKCGKDITLHPEKWKHISISTKVTCGNCI